MKRTIFLLIILYGLVNELSSQTTDLTILLLLKNSLNENLCQELSSSKNLLKLTQKKDTCIFKCNVENIRIKADSTILTVGIRSFIAGDYMELCQYFNNLDSAIIEYSEYISHLIQEFNIDTKFYKYELIKIKDLDSTYYGSTELYKESYRIDVIKLQSINSVLFISLDKRQQMYIINTSIK